MVRQKRACGPVRITAAEVKKRKAYLQISSEDERRIAKAHRTLEKHADEMIEGFYRYLFTHEHTRKILQSPGLVDRLKKIQRDYFARLTRGRYDRDYFEDRLRIGHAHERIGLTPEWYLGAYNKYLIIVGGVLSREMGRDYQGFFETFLSVIKVIYLDMGLAMDAYIFAGQARLKERTRLLAEIDAKKRLLADTIVHDLRNPVAGIQGFLSLLKADCGRLSDSQRIALEEAERACLMLNGMVDNILDISRMEDGKLELARETVDVTGMVDQTARILRPFAATRKREILVRAPKGSLEAKTDEQLVRRILFNLVINSIRHAAGATKVEIRARREGKRVRLEVADDGAGIPREYHSVLFKKFGATGPKAAGLKLDTGLGLVFCRMASDLLGAKLALKSGEGRGTEVSILL
jgi:signal transduction histidine kinase